MGLAALAGDEAAAVALATHLVMGDILTLALASGACKDICRLALRRVRLQALGGREPAEALRRLLASPLTDRGQALVELDVAFCRLSNAALQALPKMPQLQSLNLDGCQDIDDEGLLAVAQRCPGLRSFSIYWNVRATDKGFGRVLRAQQGKALVSLSFSGCKQLTDETVQRLVGRGPQLEVLDLTRCPHVSDAGCLLICECLDHLKVLRLYAMTQLSPLAFQPLRRLVMLEELDLCGCRVEDAALVDFLAASSPAWLRTLNLTWCPALTDATANAVAANCPRLDWLSYFGNLHITDAAVEALAAGPCGGELRNLDVRGLAKAPKYATDAAALRRLFPALVSTELHH